MFASPDTQVILAVDENRFAEWAEPLSLRQREQWHRKKLSNSPDMRNFTAPQRHCPVVGLLSIHTPRDRQALPSVKRILLSPCIRVLDPGQKGLKERQSRRRRASRIENHAFRRLRLKPDLRRYFSPLHCGSSFRTFAAAAFPKTAKLLLGGTKRPFDPGYPTSASFLWTEALAKGHPNTTLGQEVNMLLSQYV